MSNQSDHLDAAEKKFVRNLKSSPGRLTKRQVEACQAGWEWAAEQCYGHGDRYELPSRIDGGSEAMDMADCLCSGGEGWRRDERDTCADYIYNGIRAMFKAMESCPPYIAPVGSEESISVEIMSHAVAGIRGPRDA